VRDLPALVADRIRAAIAYRKGIVSGTDAWRVVFSEGDFLPGLIVDRYHDVLSVQILTQAMDTEPVRAAIVHTLTEELKRRGSWSAWTAGFANWSSCRRGRRDCCGETRVRPWSR